jgi:UDP:flavonoid glycosyltransferase YjiC (YdhE family)
VVTHARFAPRVLAHGLEYAALEGDPSELLNARPEALTLEGGVGRAALATLRYLREARPLYARMLASAWAACAGASAVVAALPTLWGVDLAEALGVPPLVAPLQPLTPTGAWPSALLPLGGSLGPRLNRLSHRLLELSLWLPWRVTIDRWRRSVGLARADTDPLARARAAGALFVYGFSPWLVPRPADWPANHIIAGHWWLEDGRVWRPPPDLAAFLDAGPPPVYLGFGSMGARRPEADAALVLEAARLAGRRVVLLGGPAARRAVAGSREIIVVDEAPHDWLLPRVAAAVHHGGAGTTHAALRAGIPSAVAPIAADQYYWGGRIAALSAGPPPAPRQVLTAERLAGLIYEAAEVPAYRRAAAALGELLRQERGVARAVEVILAVGTRS